MNKTAIISDMFVWIDKFVIQENICPFANKERDRGSIAIDVYDATNLSTNVTALLQWCETLSESKIFETCLLVAYRGLENFDEFLLQLDELNYQLEKSGWVGTYQIASFHPNYQFNDEPEGSLSHYTNRAPYPCFHIIKEASITQALASFAKPDSIPLRNIKHCEALGEHFFKNLFKQFRSF